ncbi:hypothetical protein [Brevundimonas lutea]|uniref:hypothetical protein n=1 Tax=Brevundimonas lutea TaxID=2293980 RepID=UPI000F02008A|nr:hypothetical protein [Brevundimonas lutea]
MPARLKVFTWSDGFHAFTVAASSRPKALEAWGVEQDLFKTGLAKEITSGEGHDAALAAPGDVIETGLAVDIGKTGKAEKPAAKSLKSDKAVRKREVERLEAKRDTLDARHSEAIEALRHEAGRIEKRIDDAESDHATALKALEAKLKAARKAL